MLVAVAVVGMLPTLLSLSGMVIVRFAVDAQGSIDPVQVNV